MQTTSASVFGGSALATGIVFVGHNNVTLFLRLQITNYSEFLFSGLHNLAKGFRLGYGNLVAILAHPLEPKTRTGTT